MPKITVKIDANVCIAAAACVDTDSTIFVLDEDNVAAVLKPDGSAAHEQTLDVSAERKTKIIEASQACPTGAISVIDASDEP